MLPSAHPIAQAQGLVHAINTTTIIRARTTASAASRRAASPSPRTLRSRHLPRASMGGGFLSGLQAAVVGRMGTQTNFIAPLDPHASPISNAP
jgi:hypothetical protein